MTLLYQNSNSVQQNFNQLNIVISSRLADKLPTYSRLWWLIRGLDERGAGKVVVDIDLLSILLNKPVQTIRRYIREGLKLGLFRRVIRNRRIYTFFYSSLIQVAKSARLENLGAFARISLDELLRLKLTATEVEAEYQQRQSAFQKKKELKSQGKDNTLNEFDDVFMPPL